MANCNQKVLVIIWSSAVPSIENSDSSSLPTKIKDKIPIDLNRSRIQCSKQYTCSGSRKVQAAVVIDYYIFPPKGEFLGEMNEPLFKFGFYCLISVSVNCVLSD